MFDFFFTLYYILKWVVDWFHLNIDFFIFTLSFTAVNNFGWTTLVTFDKLITVSCMIPEIVQTIKPLSWQENFVIECTLTQPLHYGQDLTQGQFLKGIYQVWIQVFFSHRPVHVPRLKSPVCFCYSLIARGKKR